jgi:hypothetical protein
MSTFHRLATLLASEPATLASDLTAGGGNTSITLTTGHGVRIDQSATYSMPMYLVLATWNSAKTAASNFEVVECTNRTGDVLTVVRAKDGTTALYHPAGTRCYSGLTGLMIDEIIDSLTAIEGGTSIEINTPSATQSIVAGTGITAGMLALGRVIAIAGSGGAVTISANPQIAAGTNGQRVTFLGTHDTNTVTFSNGTGLLMLYPGTSATLKNGDEFCATYRTGLGWVEQYHTRH